MTYLRFRRATEIRGRDGLHVRRADLETPADSAYDSFSPVEMIRFRGALLRQSGLPRPYVDSRPLEIVELELPDPGPGEVLVKIGAASLCRSDLSVITGARVWPLPMVVGHEAAGRVEAVGSGVGGLAPGDDVILVYLPQCGACGQCRRGRPWLCEAGTAANQQGHLLTGGTRLRHGGEPIYHHMGLAAFAEFALVSEASAIKVPAGLPPGDTCVFGCAVLCGAGTAINTAGIEPGQSAAVIGLGAVGLSAVMGAASAGAGQIFALDVLPTKLVSAGELGATDVAAVESDTADRVRGATGGGVDHAIEASGTLEGFELAMSVVGRGGKVTALGLPGPGTSYPLQLAPLVVAGATVQGSYLGSCDARRDVPRFIEMYRSGNLAADALISHRIELEDLNAAFDRLAEGGALRQVIHLEG